MLLLTPRRTRTHGENVLAWATLRGCGDRRESPHLKWHFSELNATQKCNPAEKHAPDRDPPLVFSMLQTDPGGTI